MRNAAPRRNSWSLHEKTRLIMKFDFIFILTYGRSGSTLLQGILNSIEGVQIRGENNGALYGVLRSFKALQTAKHTFGKDSSDPANPWYGATDIKVDAFGRQMAKAFVDNVLCPSEGVRVSGFKEIRYYPPGLDDAAFADCLFFMRHYLRRAALVINTRNMDDVLRSNRIAGHNVSETAIQASDARLRQLASSGAEDVFHVHYDDYVSAPEKLEGLFSFLGAPFDVERIRSVLDVVHSTVSPKPAPPAEPSQAPEEVVSDRT